MRTMAARDLLFGVEFVDGISILHSKLESFDSRYEVCINRHSINLNFVAVEDLIDARCPIHDVFELRIFLVVLLVLPGEISHAASYLQERTECRSSGNAALCHDLALPEFECLFNVDRSVCVTWFQMVS